ASPHAPRMCPPATMASARPFQFAELPNEVKVRWRLGAYGMIAATRTPPPGPVGARRSSWAAPTRPPPEVLLHPPAHSRTSRSRLSRPSPPLRKRRRPRHPIPAKRRGERRAELDHRHHVLPHGPRSPCDG